MIMSKSLMNTGYVTFSWCCCSKKCYACFPFNAFMSQIRTVSCSPRRFDTINSSAYLPSSSESYLFNIFSLSSSILDTTTLDFWVICVLNARKPRKGMLKMAPFIKLAVAKASIITRALAKERMYPGTDMRGILLKGFDTSKSNMVPSSLNTRGTFGTKTRPLGGTD